DDPLPPPVPEGDVEAAATQVPNYVQLTADVDVQRKKIAEIMRVARPERRLELTVGARAEMRRLEEAQREVPDLVPRPLADKARIQVVEQEKRALAELEEKIAAQRQLRDKMEKNVEKWAAAVEGFKNGILRAPPEILALRDQVDLREAEQKRLGEQKAGLE